MQIDVGVRGALAVAHYGRGPEAQHPALGLRGFDDVVHEVGGEVGVVEAAVAHGGLAVDPGDGEAGGRADDADAELAFVQALQLDQGCQPGGLRAGGRQHGGSGGFRGLGRHGDGGALAATGRGGAAAAATGSKRQEGRGGRDHGEGRLEIGVHGALHPKWLPTPRLAPGRCNRISEDETPLICPGAGSYPLAGSGCCIQQATRPSGCRDTIAGMMVARRASCPWQLSL